MNRGLLSLPLYLVLLISLLSGCATVDQKITLTYQPFDQTIGNNSGEVFVSRIDTSTPLRNRKGEWIIGSLNNVHAVREADLLSNKALGEWVSDALIQELKQAGYTVAYSVKPPVNAARSMTIRDINVFLNVNSGAVSTETRHELKFNVDIFSNGTLIKTFTIAAIDNKTLALGASIEEKELIMRQSLQDAMRQIIPDLIALFSRQ